MVYKSLQAYRSIILKTCLLIYVSGALHLSGYELIHTCMHLQDIILLDYTHHNHQHEDQSTADHDHGNQLDYLDSYEDNEDSQEPVASDEQPKHEIVQRSALSTITLYKLRLSPYRFSLKDIRIARPNPPPQVS